MIEGLLRHCTDAAIDTSYVDTLHATFTALLGHRGHQSCGHGHDGQVRRLRHRQHTGKTFDRRDRRRSRVHHVERARKAARPGVAQDGPPDRVGFPASTDHGHDLGPEQRAQARHVGAALTLSYRVQLGVINHERDGEGDDAGLGTPLRRQPSIGKHP